VITTPTGRMEAELREEEPGAALGKALTNLALDGRGRANRDRSATKSFTLLFVYALHGLGKPQRVHRASRWLHGAYTAQEALKAGVLDTTKRRPQDELRVER
jgi:hypothetical protein